MDIIDLGVGDPDMPTPPEIIGAMVRAVRDPANHRYPSYSGMEDFRGAIAEWYDERFSVRLDAQTEVMALIGAKENSSYLVGIHRSRRPRPYPHPRISSVQYWCPFCWWEALFCTPF